MTRVEKAKKLLAAGVPVCEVLRETGIGPRIIEAAGWCPCCGRPLVLAAK